MKRVSLLLAILLSLCVARADAAMSDCIDATCRITTPDGGCGTGVVYHRDAENVWVLTNAHIATTNTPTLEFWRDGHLSRKVSGRTIMRNEKADAAVIVVDASQFGGLLPSSIPIDASGRLVPNRGTVTSVGCAKGGWASAWKGHAIRYDGDDLLFLPIPVLGRSGSAIFDAAGERIVGLLRGRDKETAEQSNFGIATSAAVLVRVIEQHNTQYRPICGPNGCPPPVNKWRASPYRAQQDRLNKAQDDRIDSLYPTMPKQQPQPKPQPRPMVPVMPPTTEIPKPVPVDPCVAIELRLSILERRLKAQGAALEQLMRLLQVQSEGGFSVVFEKGDESDEVERIVYVESGGVLRIPAQMLRIRTVDRNGRNVGEPITDVAPLGSPLKVRNKLK